MDTVVTKTNKKIRQYIGLSAAVLTYYLIHEGAHLVTALCMGVFKEVRFMGIGMQIDVAAAQMTDLQMGIFCLAGAVCTLMVAVLLTLQLESEFGGDRCFGILANMDFIMVCTYETEGANPELLLYKNR